MNELIAKVWAQTLIKILLLLRKLVCIVYSSSMRELKLIASRIMNFDTLRSVLEGTVIIVI